MSIIKTVCHRDCPDTCFLDVGVADGKILSVRGSREHPITQGFACPRGRGDPQRVYSSERVLYPHVKQSGKWKRVGWDEALSQLTVKLQSARESGGQESVLLYDYPGNQGFLAWQFPQRLWQALATAFKGSFTDKSFDDLLNGEMLALKSHRKAEYQTPSGRIEFFASRTSDTGAHGIPRQMECSENRDALTLLNSSLRNYTHSQFTDVYGPIPPMVWINEKDARAKGIAAGDTVILCNERGEVPVKAVVNNKVGPGLLWAPRPLTGLDGTPLNILATGTAQKMWGGPEFGRLKVRLRKAAS